MLAGVTLMDPAATYIDRGVEIGQDTVIYPNCFLLGRTSLGVSCVIEPGCKIVDARIGNAVTVKASSVISESVIEDQVEIGPFAHLRPQTTLRERSKVGNFVELKKSVLGKGTKANHLSYLDYAAVMFSLPAEWRYSSATAAWEEFFFRESASLPMKLWKRFTYEYGTMALNLFPLPQKGAVRHALAYMGRLADMGRNILLFPEGERSRHGSLLPFRPGLGLMVKELRMPVVPVHIFGIEKIMPPGQAWPKRGRVAVAFGDPIAFGKETPEEIVEKARKAVLDLAAR